MKYTNILNELLDSGEKFKVVPKIKYEAEHAPYTFYINKTIIGINIYFSLPTVEGVKKYVFMYYNKIEGAEIHFSIQKEDGNYSNDYTGFNNAADVIGAVVKFTKMAIKMYNSPIIHIICKDGDASRKRVYLLLANKIGAENGYKINKTFNKSITGSKDKEIIDTQIIELVKNAE